MSRFLSIAARALTALALVGGQAALAQESYPAKPIRIIIGFAAGGGTDLVLRAISERLSVSMGVPVIVDNRPGANGNIAGAAVAKAAPDGYTLLYNTSSMVLSPHMYAKLSYDHTRELTPIALTANIPLVLAVYPGVPADTAQDLVAYLKANPGKVSFASAGIGNVTHLAAERMLQGVGARAVHVPYKSEAPAIPELIGGQVQFYLGTANAIIPQVRQKRLKALGVGSLKRLDTIPEVPTLAETILPGVELGAWSGIMAPANTPASIVSRLNAEVNKVLKEPELRAKIAETGAEVRGSSVEQYAAFIRTESEHWGQAVRAAGLKPE